ncbi:MAG: M20/M25/M40 family metallo-hydrolase [Paucibacter sp.]|nr:M20/M25/M40 family metallo-hydrolase [Roseateles sp.]
MRSFLLTVLLISSLHANAGPDEALLAAARAEQQPMLDSLAEFCAIETGSREPAGLQRLAQLLMKRLDQLGGEVELIAPTEVYRMEDTPEQPGAMVRATFRGNGTRSVLLLAHMDTVYPSGSLARQPFQLRGDRAYGLGILDDKQGLALVLHTLALLRARGFDDYARITVLFNGDEEISSPASRALITRLGAEHDAVLSFEGTGREAISLATSGIAAVHLDVRGRAAHAAAVKGAGVNALDELAHQILQTRRLFSNDDDISLAWTQARAGEARNMLPPTASADADVRVRRLADFERVEARLRSTMAEQLLPEARLEMRFERRRPPMEATLPSRMLGAAAVAIAAELGHRLELVTEPEGGGTDAAFAALQAKGPVLESLGLRGGGAHGSQTEYVRVDSIVPRLYMAAKLIQTASRK